MKQVSDFSTLATNYMIVQEQKTFAHQVCRAVETFEAFGVPVLTVKRAELG